MRSLYLQLGEPVRMSRERSSPHLTLNILLDKRRELPVDRNVFLAPADKCVLHTRCKNLYEGAGATSSIRRLPAARPARRQARLNSNDYSVFFVHVPTSVTHILRVCPAAPNSHTCLSRLSVHPSQPRPAADLRKAQDHIMAPCPGHRRSIHDSNPFAVATLPRPPSFSRCSESEALRKPPADQLPASLHTTTSSLACMFALRRRTNLAASPTSLHHQPRRFNARTLNPDIKRATRLSRRCVRALPQQTLFGSRLEDLE